MIAAAVSIAILGACDFRDSGGENAPEPAKLGAGPNVLLIVIDTLGADHLGSYGAGGDISPNLDRLAAEGRRFANAYTVAPWTQPSMASLFTGRMPSAHRLQNLPGTLAPGHSTLAERFEDAGYRTHGVVSHFLLGKKFGFSQGFSSYDESAVQKHTGISSERVTDSALTWLTELKGDGGGTDPFFLFVHYFDPHFVYHDHRSIDLAEASDGPVESGMPIWELRDIRADLESSDIEYLVSLYREEIVFTDQHVGRLIDFLDEAGLGPNTLVVVTSDHGEELMEHGWIGHTRTLYGELLRVPLLLRQPGVISPGVVERNASLVDISPTLADIVLGADAGGAEDGRSLGPLLFDRSDEFAARRLYSEVSLDASDDRGKVSEHRPEKVAHKTALLGQRWKLIHDRTTDEFELYDLRADPGDRDDQWGTDPLLDASLRRELLEWECCEYRQGQ